jgi:release factor glutamine methyltransferase
MAPTEGVVPTASPNAGAALLNAIGRLRVAGSPTPRLDAEVLLAHATGRDRAWVLAHPEAALDPETFDGFESTLERRAAGEPIAYIRGFKEWRSLRIRTDARALIPRPETELLADAAISEIADRMTRDDRRIVAWEAATGSGAVAVALALRFQQALALDRLALIASDVSPEALELASENLAAYGVAGYVTLACADLLEPAGSSLPRPEVIVANLPYVASSEVEERQGSLGYEPRIALDGGPDGLHVLRRLLAHAPHHAAPGATLLLELGVGQVELVGALAPVGASVEVVPDLAGLDRVIRVQLP